MMLEPINWVDAEAHSYIQTQNANKKDDLLVIDLLNHPSQEDSYYPPSNFLTYDFFKTLQKRIKNNGLLAIFIQ